MKSLTELYRIGMGPSSSHTMGPRRASQLFATANPTAARYQVILEGSLAATGKGHLTDRAVIEGLCGSAGVEAATTVAARVEILWRPEVVPAFHPNGMECAAFDAEGAEVGRQRYYSVGGGAIVAEGAADLLPEVYHFRTAAELLQRAEDQGVPLWHIAETDERAAGTSISEHLSEVWTAMRAAIDRGLTREEPLPGPLRLRRRACAAFAQSKRLSDARTATISAYALAVSEENGGGGIVVTAPTCGSAGVIPGLFRYLQEELQLDDTPILRALATAGLFGNLIKRNASISGAEVGCQGEVGSACAMAAAGAAQLLGGTPHQIECAAEMGLEHHLGLTCDPVAGLVQIPCIERNAMAALRALTCAEYALLFDGRHRVSFDQVVETMMETGHALPSLYRETSTGGLARQFHLS